MYYVYIIQSSKTKKFYIGFTDDLKRRYFEHNDGLSIATNYGRPWEILYYEAYKSQKDARIREKRLKHHGKGKANLIERLKNSISM